MITLNTILSVRLGNNTCELKVTSYNPTPTEMYYFLEGPNGRGFYSKTYLDNNIVK